MELSLLKCKIHRATVTETHVDYEGSCAIDETLLEAAGMREFEQIHLWNVTNGERLTTYAIRGLRGSGMISVNGSAAHKANAGDILIIAAFARMSEQEADRFQPHLVYVDEKNQIRSVGRELANPSTTPEQAVRVPHVPVAQSVTEESVVCLICGKVGKSIRGHITKTHRIDIPTYLANYGLPKDFPLVAPAYSATRRQLAIAAGAGEKLRASRGKKGHLAGH
jgi:aspartate 1-decarboxylase